MRFAPAPSGELHVGGARTALFDWLFARRHGGTFVLRVEDTDQSRVTEEAVGQLQEALRWLGIDWDEGPGAGGDFGPYRQSERLGLYRELTDRLIDEDKAYRCYCTPEELEVRRKAALEAGEKPGYDGRCRSLSGAERAAFEAEGRPFAVRFATPGRDVTFTDLVKGETTFAGPDITDFVILRSSGIPTYLLAAAADDWKMELTHVIRGEDLFSSTPRQILLLEALGADRIPGYAHLPLIVGPDRAPLSKRHGSVAVERFREEGFLPEAMVNYLALLGWSYDDHTTFFSREELVERFDLARVSHNPAAFDREKLEWMNGHYLRELPDERVGELLGERLRGDGIEPDADLLPRAVPLVKERIKLLSEAPGMLRFLFEDVVADEKAAKMLGGQGEYLGAVADRLDALEDWSVEAIEEALRALKEERELGSKKAFQPVRAAVTGSLVSPPLFESIELLGKDSVVERLRKAAV